MTFVANIYSTVLLASGIITLLLCINIFRRYEIVVRLFGFMVLAIAVWALSYGFELASTYLDEMLFWINFEYLGVSFLPTCWFFSIVNFTGKDEWITKRNIAARISLRKTNGRIWVESELKRGSKFFVELPATGENIIVQEQIQAEL